jgi:hypothetical protein
LESTTIGWNPDKFVWGGGYLDAVEQTAQGIGVVGDWSTGNRTGGVTRGDRVFLLRQGTQERGIIAGGTVLKDISWDNGLLESPDAQGADESPWGVTSVGPIGSPPTSTNKYEESLAPGISSLKQCGAQLIRRGFQVE